jgi:adenylate cyclase
VAVHAVPEVHRQGGSSMKSLHRINRKMRNNLRRLVLILLIWLTINSVMFFMGYTYLSTRAPDITSTNDLWWNYSIILLSTAMAGLIGGPFLIFNIQPRFRKRPYWMGILYTGSMFLIIYLLISFTVSSLFVSHEFDKPIWHRDVMLTSLVSFVTAPQWNNLAFWTLLVAGTQFMLQVNEKFGPGVMRNMILGKYHSPKEETRVFMFLDLKNSTGIAERLGHLGYYHLLNECFADITDPVINRKGHIYQYVGDEVVVSWRLQDALEDANCLHCFFDIQARLGQRAPRYRQRFGFEPEFKAGIHYGQVTVGEIGLIKRDIVFTGDVLNTTSGIQESCNAHKASLLVSSDLLKVIGQRPEFAINSIGKISLKGRKKRVAVAVVGRRETSREFQSV